MTRALKRYEKLPIHHRIGQRTYLKIFYLIPRNLKLYIPRINFSKYIQNVALFKTVRAFAIWYYICMNIKYMSLHVFRKKECAHL